MLEIIDSICRFVGQFRWRWGAGFLIASESNYISKSNQENVKTDSNFALKNNLLSGWYMLEIQIKFPAARVNGHISLGEDNKIGTTLHLRFPLRSGSVCKRLIYLRDGGKFRFGVPISHKDIELLHFCLARVTQKFACSRMLRKLQALHPRYKVRHGLMQQAENNSVPTWLGLIGLRHRKISGFDDFSEIWADYCAIFEGSPKSLSYPEWIRQFDTLTDVGRAALLARAEQFEYKPMVSIVMPVYNPNPNWLEEAIASVSKQIYPNWELCIADDSSTNPAIRPLLERYMRSDQRIKVVFREQNGHISAASNSALAMSTGKWVALLDHDDVLAEHALFWVVDVINKQPACRLIYSDEDKIDEMSEHSEPYFKCDWNLDLFYSQNMFSHLGVYQADLVRNVGGFRIGMEGSQDYDLALRCIEHIAAEQIHHIPRVLYHWRMHKNSTAYDLDSKPYAMIAGARALNEHFERKGVKAKAESVGYGYRVRYDLPDSLPMVSLIILTRNGLKLLKQCIESILVKTSYSNYEILIVDNGSDDPGTLRYLHKLATESRIRVIRDDSPFNYSALNNTAVKLARGVLIGLINNDIEVISPDWLSEMVSHALRPEIGAVGAKLWYGDDTIQHAGVILGVHGIAGHVHRFLPKANAGYCGRAVLIQSFSAVTGACLVVRKMVYEEMGGLNEKDLQVACNDVDFCLRVREAGYRIIWTPYAELYHHESATRGFDDTPKKLARSAKEVAYMKQHWRDLLQNDPAYSPNLTLDAEDIGLAWPPRVESVVDRLYGYSTESAIKLKA